MINIEIITPTTGAIGAIATNDTFDLSLTEDSVPGVIVAGGIQSGETVAIYKSPYDGAAQVALVEGGVAKTLSDQDTQYLIEAPGDYQLKFTGIASGANAAEIVVGFTGVSRAGR
jgi:hypothetical protein